MYVTVTSAVSSYCRWAGLYIRELALTPDVTLQDCKHGGGKKVK